MQASVENILVLSSHTDDGEIGAGGTVHKLAQRGANITYVAFSAAEESVPDPFPRDVLRKEVLRATEQLCIPNNRVSVLDYKVRHFPENRQRILEDLIVLRNNHDFDLVFVPSPDDIHQDHVTLSNEAIRAFKSTSILGYEIPWNNRAFCNTMLSPISKENLDAKIRSLAEYQSQQWRGYVSADAIKALATIRGLQCQREYAESFEVIKWYLN